MKEFIVIKNEEGIRYSKYIKKLMPNMPDSLSHKLFRKKYFELNKKKSDGNEILKFGDKVSIFLGDETYKKYAISNDDKIKQRSNVTNKFIISSEYFKDIHKRIIYEDENIILYNKQEGLLSQGDKSGSISVNEILNEYTKVSDKIHKPSVVNRLDRNTSGIIIFAKTYMAAREISKMIKENRLKKHYKTIVNGVVKKNFEKLTHLYKKDEKSNKAIIRDYNGKILNGYSIIELEYKVLKRNKDTTLLDVNLITGKSHQIRAELAYIGHPIICDKKYMDIALYSRNVSKYNKNVQELCCYKIVFDKFENELLKNIEYKTFSLE